jgi:hypothetical protein
MPKEKPGTIIAVVSDTHIASTTGLCLPEWTIQGAKPDESQTIKASAAANWIHDNWREYWDYVKNLAGVRGRYRKHRIVTLHIGDILEGTHHDTKQVMLPMLSDQIDMAAEIMTQVSNISDGGVYGSHGTPAHAGELYQAERAVSLRAGFRAYEPELHLQIDGLTVWAFHHGNAGKSDWTSSASRVATMSRLYAQDLDEAPPDYVFTGHHHVIDDSGHKLKTRALTCPSWQLRTMFGAKVASNRRSDIGGFIILPGGQLDASRARYMAEISRPKVITV